MRARASSGSADEPSGGSPDEKAPLPFPQPTRRSASPRMAPEHQEAVAITPARLGTARPRPPRRRPAAVLDPTPRIRSLPLDGDDVHWLAEALELQ